MVFIRRSELVDSSTLFNPATGRFVKRDKATAKQLIRFTGKCGACESVMSMPQSSWVPWNNEEQWTGWNPLSWEKQTSVAPSAISGGGQGLFATQHIPRNSIITRYSGAIVSTQEARELRDQGRSTHTRTLTLQHNAIQGIRSQEWDRIDNILRRFVGKGSLANDARNTQYSNNAIFHTTTLPGNTAVSLIVLKATRNIKKGEEIFVSYGAGYWNSQ